MLSEEDNKLLTETGAGTPMGNLLRRYWIPALVTEDLPEPDCPPVRVKIMGEELVAFRDSHNNIALLDEYCPHRRASLFFGRNEEGGLRCVYHGWKFDTCGTCVDMPSEPAESNFKDKVKTNSYPCKEFGGVIWAYMGPPELMPELPQLPFGYVDKSYRQINRWEIESNYSQGIESAVDSSHISFLHRRKSENLNEYEKVRNKFGSPKFEVIKTDYGLMIGARRSTEDPSVVYWRITQHILPWYQMVAPFKLNSDPDDVSFISFWVPIDDTKHMSWLIVSDPLYSFDDPNRRYKLPSAQVIPGTLRMVANRSNHYLMDRQLQASGKSFTGISNVQTEDQAMIESQGPIADRSKERLGTSDTAIIVGRQIAIRAAKALQQGETPPGLDPKKTRVRAVSIMLPEGVPFYEGAKHLLNVSE